MRIDLLTNSTNIDLVVPSTMCKEQSLEKKTCFEQAQLKCPQTEKTVSDVTVVINSLTPKPLIKRIQFLNLFSLFVRWTK